MPFLFFFQSKNLETLPILERRIKELAEENKQLHAEATELANEAKECEEKEEKLGSDFVFLNFLLLLLYFLSREKLIQMSFSPHFCNLVFGCLWQ